MEILFVAKHDSGDNDDEGAVAFALRKLGHDVTLVHELRRHRTRDQADALARSRDFDFCLFFKWGTVSEIAALECPAAFWFFDMVRSVSNDPSLLSRSESRIRWMYDVVPHVVAGFCTDGDWVRTMNRDPSSPAWIEDKLVHLAQGADERVTGFGVGDSRYCERFDVLFTGMKHHGRDRAAHVDHLQVTWGKRFTMLGDGGPRRRLHGRQLADLFAATKVVVAPNGPNTDSYWSNRVYLTLGFGGFLLHPYCEKLLQHYTHDQLVTYRSVEECDELIDFYLRHPDDRFEMQTKGYARTILDHTYWRRCAELVSVVKERI